MNASNRTSRRRFLGAASAGAVSMGLPFVHARAQAPIKLRYYSWVPRNVLFAQSMNIFAKQVETASRGELVIEWGGSAEATPPFQAADAIVSGLYDMGHLGNSLYASAMPEAICLSATTASAEKLRKSGALDAYAEAMKTRTGMIFLGMPISGVGYTFLTRTPINSLADFKGRKLRSLPLYDPLLRALGATPSTIAPAEVFTALENGVVDGLGWSDSGIIEYRFHEKTKFRLTPNFYGARTALVVSPVAWRRLSPAQQQILTASGLQFELEAEKFYVAEHAKEQQQLVQLGMTTTILPAAEGTQFLASAEKTMWDRIVGASPKTGPLLKAAFEKAVQA